jgi:6-phosphogluconolactonase
VHALAISGDGTLRLLSTQPTGAKPAHVVVHPNGRYLFTSMYDDGSIATHPILPDGNVGPVCDRRRHSRDGHPGNAHQVVFDPAGKYVLAVDLGVDRVIVYQLDDERRRLVEHDRTELKPGSGPRHLVFHPDGNHAYVAGELDSTVTVCHWQDGRLTVQAVYPAHAGQAGQVGQPAEPNYPGEILISADGRFVYVSNRGSNTIAVFAVEDDGAALRLLAAESCGGDWPRHLAIDDTGRWLYAVNERSGDITWFPVDPESGLLGAAAGRLPVAGPAQMFLVPR